MGIQTLEPHLVETLRNASWEIFETMVFITPTSAEPLAEPLAERSKQFRSAVTGLLGFTGTRSGSFVVLTSRNIANLMVAKMLMKEPGELSDSAEIADAFGEIVNMISGSFKNTWVAAGNKMELSIPHVVEDGKVTLGSQSVEQLRSGVRLRIGDEFVDIGVHFEA